MKFAVITHVPHKPVKDSFFAYEPYVREMNLWFKYIDEVEIVAPIVSGEISKIDAAYRHENIHFNEIPSIEFTSLKKAFISILKIPVILAKIYNICKRADHIHLRCPGNIGLLGCLVQVFFPKKTKTAKYAGNWDPLSKQPLSYRFQKWLLNNTFFTKSMQVLVYGEWKEQSRNIKSFFTATYYESDKHDIDDKVLAKKETIFDNEAQKKFLFIGTLSEGKRPLLSAKIILQLLKKGYNVRLDIYGEGKERDVIHKFVKENNMEKHITLHGNTSGDVIKSAYTNAHFLLFLSKSEGWPKVIAEAMFWGCLPISTHVSCIPYMLDYGKRGAVVEANTDKIISVLENYFLDSNKYYKEVKNAMIWSRQFTMEKFDKEISYLVK